MTRGAPGAPGHVVEYFDQLYAGVQTASGQLAADNYEVFQVLVRANPDNTGRVLVGNALTQAFPLDAGDSVTIPIDNLTKIFVTIATVGDEVAWLAMG